MLHLAASELGLLFLCHILKQRMAFVLALLVYGLPNFNVFSISETS